MKSTHLFACKNRKPESFVRQKLPRKPRSAGQRESLNAQAGTSFDPDKFMAFVRGRSFESPRGPVSIDKTNGDITQNVYIRRAEKIDGVLQNVEIETLPNQGFK